MTIVTTLSRSNGSTGIIFYPDENFQGNDQTYIGSSKIR